MKNPIPQAFERLRDQCAGHKEACACCEVHWSYYMICLDQGWTDVETLRHVRDTCEENMDDCACCARGFLTAQEGLEQYERAVTLRQIAAHDALEQRKEARKHMDALTRALARVRKGS